MKMHEIATQYGWRLESKPYDGSMGFLPCDNLGTNVFCVFADDRLIGHSQLSYDRAIEDAVNKCVTTHVAIDYNGEQHIVIQLDRYQAFQMAQGILAQLYEGDPHIFTFMGTVRKVDHSRD